MMVNTDPPVLSVEEAVKLMEPTDQLLASSAGTFMAEGILLWQSLWLQRPARYSHAMRYYKNGLVVSQDLFYGIKPLSNWAGAWILIWRNTAYTDRQRQAIMDAMHRDLDRPMWARLYDVPGIVGQICKPIPIIGNRAAKLVEVPWLNFCSEGEILRERKADPLYMAGQTQGSPADMNSHNEAHPAWQKVAEFKLKK